MTRKLSIRPDQIPTRLNLNDVGLPLDSRPYASDAATCNAQRFLSPVGLPEVITEMPFNNAYIIRRYAADPAELRRGLRRCYQSSRLPDTLNFSHGLEGYLRHPWRHWAAASVRIAKPANNRKELSCPAISL